MMRRYCCFSLLAYLALTLRAEAVDLTTIDRTIGKEPVYQSKNPQYCLLVFGLEAKVRVWMVLDGKFLYLDCNGNGDLTDPGERIPGHKEELQLQVRPYMEAMSFESGDFWDEEVTIFTCGAHVCDFSLFHRVFRESHDMPVSLKRLQDKPSAVLLRTRKLDYSASFTFASRAENAPILHFDGPRHVTISDKPEPLVFRRGESTELFVELTTPGLNGTVTTCTDRFTRDLHPVAEFEFQSKWPGGNPRRLRVELKGRC